MLVFNYPTTFMQMRMLESQPSLDDPDDHKMAVLEYMN